MRGRRFFPSVPDVLREWKKIEMLPVLRLRPPPRASWLHHRGEPAETGQVDPMPGRSWRPTSSRESVKSGHRNGNHYPVAVCRLHDSRKTLPGSFIGPVGEAKIARFGTGAGRQKPFGGKSSPEQFAYCRRPARHALLEPEILDQGQLLGGKHDLKPFTAKSLPRHVTLHDPRAEAVALGSSY
jgi:hypothetical protein